MKNYPVGFRSSPMDEELINFYQKNRILGNSWLLDDSISEINIYSYEPAFLPGKFLNLNSPWNQSCCLIWVIEDRIEWSCVVLLLSYESTKKRPRRTTRSGFWKVTIGKSRIREHWICSFREKVHRFGWHSSSCSSCNLSLPPSLITVLHRTRRTLYRPILLPLSVVTPHFLASPSDLPSHPFDHLILFQVLETPKSFSLLCSWLKFVFFPVLVSPLCSMLQFKVFTCL